MHFLQQGFCFAIFMSSQNASMENDHFYYVDINIYFRPHTERTHTPSTHLPTHPDHSDRRNTPFRNSWSHTNAFANKHTNTH